MASRQSWKNERKSPSKYGNPLKTDILSYFQLWRLVIFEPVGVQRNNVSHFKGLIRLYLDSRRSSAWQDFYLVPHPFEKGHFKGRKDIIWKYVAVLGQKLNKNDLPTAIQIYKNSNFCTSDRKHKVLQKGVMIMIFEMLLLQLAQLCIVRL